jgi:hypothetical protein
MDSESRRWVRSRWVWRVWRVRSSLTGLRGKGSFRGDSKEDSTCVFRFREEALF